MENLPSCPECNSTYTYKDGHLYVCPECFNEWTVAEENDEVVNEDEITRDAYGNLLSDGDNISVIKDLNVNGSSSKLKRGTIVKNIKIVEGDHDIDCKIDGFGAMQLKSEYVKKL